MMEEIWKDIKGYEGKYQISNLGKVKSLNYNNTKQEKILKESQDKGGYKLVRLSKNRKGATKRVHRLVAENFINMPILEVNHIDGNKKNNNVKNLEWVTPKENMRHAFQNGLCVIPNEFKSGKNNGHARAVFQYNLDGEFIRRWDCIADIERELGIGNSHITECCRNKIKSSGGFKWRYADE